MKTLNISWLNKKEREDKSNLRLGPPKGKKETKRTGWLIEGGTEVLGLGVISLYLSMSPTLIFL